MTSELTRVGPTPLQVVGRVGLKPSQQIHLEPLTDCVEDFNTPAVIKNKWSHKIALVGRLTMLS